MSDSKRYGEEYRQAHKGQIPVNICELCGEPLDIDPESGEVHCPVCETPEE